MFLRSPFLGHASWTKTWRSTLHGTYLYNARLFDVTNPTNYTRFRLLPSSGLAPAGRSAVESTIMNLRKSWFASLTRSWCDPVKRQETPVFLLSHIRWVVKTKKTSIYWATPGCVAGRPNQGPNRTLLQPVA